MKNIKLRYHHIMCLPRFKGEGYSEKFCANMTEIKKAVTSSKYKLVDFCDDICSHCPNMTNGKCKDEEKVSAYDKAIKQALDKGVVPLPAEICSDCKWYYICKNIDV